MNSKIKILCLLKHITGVRKRLCDDRVEHDVRRSDGITGSHHTELELVTCKRER